MTEQERLLTRVTTALEKISSLACQNGLDTTDGEEWYVETPQGVKPETLTLMGKIVDMLEEHK